MAETAVKADQDGEELDLKLIIETRLLDDVVTALTSLVQESRFRFLPNRIRSWAVDPANVAAVFVDLEPSEYEQIQHYSVQEDGLKIGVSLQGGSGTPWEDLIKHADADELIQIEHGPRHNWKFNWQAGGIDADLTGIDFESVRKEPDRPGFHDQLAAKFSIDGATLKEAIDVADMFSDHVTIESDGESVRFVAAGDTNQGTFERTEGEGDLEFQQAGEGESSVSLDYMKDMAKVMKDYDRVQIELGTEMPVLFHTDLFDMLLAPRIQTD